MAKSIHRLVLWFRILAGCTLSGVGIAFLANIHTRGQFYTYDADESAIVFGGIFLIVGGLVLGKAVLRFFRPLSGSESSKKANVLILHSDTALLNFFSEALERRGHFVGRYQDALHALNQLQESKNTADVLVTNLNIPGMSWSEFYDEIRASDRARNVPIIVVSASIDRLPASVNVAAKFKAPCAPTDLIAAVEKAAHSA